MKTDHGIYKIFFIQVAVFICSIISIAFIVFYFSTVSQTEKRVESDFHSEMFLIEENVEHQIILSIENVKAMSSRTMIRKALFSYHNNEISLSELQDYTQSKYVDGAGVYSNMISATREAANGSIVAKTFTDDFHFPSFQNNNYVKIIEKDGSYFLIIRNEIIHNELYIGSDTVVFDFSRVLDIETNFINNLRICNKNDFNNVIDSHIISVPIGEYGCYLYGELNNDYLTMEKRKQVKTVIGFSLILLILPAKNGHTVKQFQSLIYNNYFPSALVSTSYSQNAS